MTNFQPCLRGDRIAAGYFALVSAPRAPARPVTSLSTAPAFGPFERSRWHDAKLRA